MLTSNRSFNVREISWAWWYNPVTPVTQEARVEEIQV
jgi:hypothetical protein